MAKSDINVITAVLSKAPSFNHIPLEAVSHLARDAEIRRVRKNRFVFQEGDSSPFFYLVKQGLVKCYKEALSGKLFIMYVARDCEVLDAVVSFSLFLLYGKFGPSLSFTIREIAEFAGTTTETAIRIIAKLKSEQVLLPQRAKIEVLEPDRLKAACCTQSYVVGQI